MEVLKKDLSILIVDFADNLVILIDDGDKYSKSP